MKNTTFRHLLSLVAILTISFVGSYWLNNIEPYHNSRLTPITEAMNAKWGTNWNLKDAACRADLKAQFQKYPLAN